ncbi:MAG: peptidase MA family metallohydrolase [Bacillota bacterium]
MDNSMPRRGPAPNRYPWAAIGLKILAASLTLAAACLVRIPGEIRGYAYQAVKELYRMHTLFASRHLVTIRGEHFLVRYSPGIAAHAPLVLETAEKAYNQLAGKYDFQGRGIPIIIYPSRAELNACFGWPASESAMGAYWAGVIRVLAPEAWIPEGDDVEEIFISSGPMVHELTHLMVDNLTKGNVPRWLTEGLAQYEEYRLTGFQFAAPEVSRKQSYSFREMDGEFDRLDDQALAYRQSLAAVEYLLEVYGENKIKRILKALAAGKNMDEALQGAIGVNLQGFESNWQNWVIQNKSSGSRNFGPGRESFYDERC